MHNRFGDSFQELFAQNLMARYNGTAFTARDLEKYIATFNYDALQDNTKDGYQYKLELAWSRVVAQQAGTDIIYYNNIIDWTFESWKPPHDNRGTAFNPRVGSATGDPIYLQNAAGDGFMLGVILRINYPK